MPLSLRVKVLHLFLGTQRLPDSSVHISPPPHPTPPPRHGPYIQDPGLGTEPEPSWCGSFLTNYQSSNDQSSKTHTFVYLTILEV